MLGKPDAGRIVVVVLFGIGTEDMPKVPTLIIGIEMILFHKWSNAICPGKILAVAKVDVFNGNLIGRHGIAVIRNTHGNPVVTSSNFHVPDLILINELNAVAFR